MVNNYDRIYREIQIEARRVSEELDVDSGPLERLALKIVDLQDRHRIWRIHDINKRIQALIEDAVQAQTDGGRES